MSNVRERMLAAGRQVVELQEETMGGAIYLRRHPSAAVRIALQDLVMQLPDDAIEDLVKAVDGDGPIPAAFKEQAQSLNVSALLYMMTDEEGCRLFGDDEYDVVAELPADGVERVAAKAMELLYMGADDLEEAKGNSPASPVLSSASA